MTTPAVQVRTLLAEIEALGGNVNIGPQSTSDEVAAAEESLGFSLPSEYREFLTSIGHIGIELVRTWFCYGLPQAKAVHARYEAELAPCREEAEEDEDAPYFPARFVVLADEGEFSNAAEGWVYDGDLEHIRFTAGRDYIERSEHSHQEYWTFLVQHLEEIRDRIADPKDVLVGGSEAAVNARRRLPT